MGMYGQWLRVSSQELARAKDDLEWATKFARDLANGPVEDEVALRRAFSTDKAWHGLAYLLDRRGFAINLVFGEQPLTGEPLDWGYGPPRYLSPAQVNLAAAELVAIPDEEFVAGVEPAELDRAQIYPGGWDAGHLAWVLEYLPALRAWYGAAAAAGDAVLCWID